MNCFRIRPEDAAELYLRSRHFRELLAGGRFCYIQGRFCLNDPRLMPHGRLSAQVILHPESYCLGFAQVWRSLPVRLPHVAYRSKAVRRMELVSLPEHFSEKLLHREEETRLVLSSLPPDFSGTLKALMQCRNITKSDLAYHLGVDERTLYRWMSGNVPGRRIVYAMGFALMAEAPLFDDLVRKAGYSYTLSKEDNLIQLMRGIWPNPGLATCNRVLQEGGCPTLTQSLIS